MAKRILLFLLMIVGNYLIASAQWKGLTVQQADGTSITIALTEHPTIYFEENKIVLRTNSGQEYNFSPNQEFEMKFCESTSGIETLLKERKLSLEGDYLVLFGQKAGVKVRIFTIDGSLVTETVVNTDGHAVIGLSTLTRGIYLIQTPSITQKIIKK